VALRAALMRCRRTLNVKQEVRAKRSEVAEFPNRSDRDATASAPFRAATQGTKYSFEPTTCFSDPSLGKQAFTGGLAGAKLSTNRTYLVDVGVNLYMIKFTNIYLDWKYAICGQPVSIGPDRSTRTDSTNWRWSSFTSRSRPNGMMESRRR
jgi:hypothetical protein